jgi:hypothetical protein
MSNDHDNGVSLLERDLLELRRPHERDEAFRRELRLALEDQAAGQPTRLQGALRSSALRRRLVILGGTVVAASLIGTVFGYVQLTGSTPLAGPPAASAATVLRAAAASGLAPGDVGHYVYSFSVQVPGSGPASAAGGGSSNPLHGGEVKSPQGSGAATGEGCKAAGTGTVDVWVAGGDPARSAQSVTLAKACDAPETLLGRFVQVGAASYGYDATHDALTLPSEPNAAPAIVLPNEAYDGASLAQSLEQLAARGSRVVALAPQTLEGTPVNVIQADGVLDRPALRVTLYLDAHTNALRGFDAASIDPAYPAPSWQVRLQSASTMAAASAPGGTFSLQSAAEAVHRVALRPDKLALPPACRGSKPTSKAGSLLAACQASDPGLTAQQLASALSQPSVQQLRQSVADGVLSAGEADAAQAQLEAELVRAVTVVGLPASARR